MDYSSLRVQIMNTQADMDEDLPNEIIYELLTILFFDVSREVSMLTVLHYDVYFSIIDEGIMIAYYKV